MVLCTVCSAQINNARKCTSSLINTNNGFFLPKMAYLLSTIPRIHLIWLRAISICSKNKNVFHFASRPCHAAYWVRRGLLSIKKSTLPKPFLDFLIFSLSRNFFDRPSIITNSHSLKKASEYKSTFLYSLFPDKISYTQSFHENCYLGDNVIWYYSIYIIFSTQQF